MDQTTDRLTVLQAKFSAYLSWSQPFVHNLVSSLGEHVTNVVVCNRTENLDRFPTPNIVRLKTRFLVTPSLAVLAAAYLEREWNPHVIHAHFGWSGIRMLLLRQFMRVPLVVTFGGRDVGVQMNLPYFDRLYRVLLEGADQIICVSNDLKDQLVARGVDPEAIVVIRRGTNLRRFRFVDRAARDPNAPIEMLMVGRLVPKKGHEYVFEALARLVREGANVRLTIVGEGEVYHRLRRLRDTLGLQKVVEFAGVTDHEGVRRHMEAADVFLHTSVTGEDGDTEGIPNVVVEASATGLPVLGTRHGGIVEPIEHERNGLLIEERDVPGMIEALRRLVHCRDERLTFGRTGAEKMRAEWDLDKQVEQHLEIYERLGSTYTPESERMQRVFIPSDFAELARDAIQPNANAREFSLLERAETLFGSARLTAGITRPRPSLLERTYDLKRYLPQPIKFPAKLLLGRFLNHLIKLRHRKLLPRWAAYQRDLDRRVLGYFEHGGSLSQIDRLLDIERMLAESSSHRASAESVNPTGPVNPE